jgi:hypothetical protein
MQHMFRFNNSKNKEAKVVRTFNVKENAKKQHKYNENVRLNFLQRHNKSKLSNKLKKSKKLYTNNGS